MEPFCGGGTTIDAAEKLGRPVDRHRHYLPLQPPSSRPGSASRRDGGDQPGSSERSELSGVIERNGAAIGVALIAAATGAVTFDYARRAEGGTGWTTIFQDGGRDSGRSGGGDLGVSRPGPEHDRPRGVEPGGAGDGELGGVGRWTLGPWQAP